MYFEWLIQVGYGRMARHYRNVNDCTVNGYVRNENMVGLALFVIFAGCPTFCTKVLYLIAIVFFFENYLIAIVLMNCTQRFCFPISEVVNNDCARLPLT